MLRPLAILVILVSGLSTIACQVLSSSSPTAGRQELQLSDSPYASAFVPCRDIGGNFLSPGIKDIGSQYVRFNPSTPMSGLYGNAVSVSEVTCREKVGVDYATFASALTVLEFQSPLDATFYMSETRELLDDEHGHSASRSWTSTAADGVIQMESYPQGDDRGVGFSMLVQVGRLVVQVARARPGVPPSISPQNLQKVHDMLWLDIESRADQMLGEITNNPNGVNQIDRILAGEAII